MPAQRLSDSVRSNSLQLELREILQSNPGILLGVSADAEKILDKMNIRSVFDLGMSAIFNAAEFIAESSGFPQSVVSRYGQVPSDVLTDAFRDKKPIEVVNERVGALRAVGSDLEKEILSHIGVETIREMSLWAPFRAAKNMILLALDPKSAEGADPEAPADLLPKTGEFPTDKVYYQSVVMIDAPAQKLQEIGSPLDLGTPVGDGFSNPTTGAILTFSQAWYPQAVTLGQLLYSLPLAPGESTKIAVIDFTRRSTGSAQEDVSQTESLSSSTMQSRAISEIASGVARETQRGRSKVTSDSISTETGVAAGGFVSPVAAGAAFGMGTNNTTVRTHASSKGKREFSAASQQNIQNSTQQNAFSSRNKRAAIVTEASQTEREQISTRTVTNYNHMHAMSVQYYEVVQMYQTQVRTEKCDRCIFIPMKIFKFNEDLALRFKSILFDAALSDRIRQLLVYSTGSVSAELDLEPGYNFSAE